jgi:hypothetical protein
MTHDIYLTLTHAVTAYDRKQEGKRGYNRYALGLYLAICEDIANDVRGGRTLAQSLEYSFNDRLRDHVARALVKSGHLASVPAWSRK